MQNGSGTFDPFFVINNISDFGKVKIGEQFQIKRPISGDNSNGYRYGTSIDTSIWLSYRWKKNFSTSLKINFDYLGNIDGEDDQMNKRMSPVMDSKILVIKNLTLVLVLTMLMLLITLKIIG